MNNEPGRYKWMGMGDINGFFGLMFDNLTDMSFLAGILIFVFGYLTFFLVSFWVFDLPRLRQRITVVGVIFSVDLAALLVFGAALRWI